MYDFPNSPAIGQITTTPTTSFRWDGAKWAPTSGGASNVPAGGTAGQALIKNSATNYDTTWGGPYLPLAGGTLTGTLSSPNITATGNLSGQAVFAGTGAGGRTDFYLGVAGGQCILNWANNWADIWNIASGLRTWQVNGATGMTLDIGQNLTVGNKGYQPGGGSWGATSDVRIKRVHSDYFAGLAEIEQLRPVAYVYLGNDTPPGGASPHATVAGKEFIGLVAQDCETVMPEMVSKRSGFIDGQAVDDLRSLDTSPLLFALINAVKELSARIKVLEAR